MQASKQADKQPIKKSINQYKQINQSNQSNNHSIRQSGHQAIKQATTNQPIKQAIKRSINQPNQYKQENQHKQPNMFIC